MKTLVLTILGMFALSCATIPTPDWFPAPDKPDGPKTVKVEEKVTYETKGTDPADIHEFQWRFGAEESDWDDDYEEIKHRFPAAGVYDVQVREQCPLKLFRSPWSDARTVTVTK